MNQKNHTKKLIEQHIEILRSLQYKSGLFAASSKNVETGYDKAWLRDNFYECLAFEVIEEWGTILKTYEALLKIFKKHEEKIDWAIKEKPDSRHKYIHARFHPETFNEFWEEWGNKQNDAIGAILFNIGKIENRKEKALLKTEEDFRICQKLVQYLESIEYWHDPDSGMWEEDEEIHASSVGACVAGLKSISRIKNIKVTDELIKKGEEKLKKLLPRESEKKFVDLALLSLIWPYELVNKKQETEILKNIEYHLVRKHGVIRYKNDYYYNNNIDGISEEAEWTMGFSWLAIIYKHLKKKEKAEEFFKKALNTMSKNHTFPELYYSNSEKHNENNPLGWAESLFCVAAFELNKKTFKEL